MLSKHRVLIVDDQEFVRTALRTMLENANCKTIYQVENGKEALVQLRNLLPTVIICDVNMKPKDGLTFLRNLRSGSQNYFDFPFIFLTSHSDAEVVQKAASLGVDGYLVKPANAERLVAAMEKAQKRHGVRTDISQTRAMVIDDDAMVRSAIKASLRSQGCEVVYTAASGDEAMAIMRSLLPTLVLSDIGMTTMDGFGFLKEIRSSSNGLFNFPVIFQTNHGEAAAVHKAAVLKVDGYLMKPVTSFKLIEKIKEICPHH